MLPPAELQGSSEFASLPTHNMCIDKVVVLGEITFSYYGY
jgi:hypothetical protein